MQEYSIESQVRQLKMSRLDQLLLKNEQISLNVKEKLIKINKSHQNINSNINSIRPMSYGSSGTFPRSNHESSTIQTQRKLAQLHQIQQSKYLGADNTQQITFNQFQTDRRESFNPFVKDKQQFQPQENRKSPYKFIKTSIHMPNLQQIKKRKAQVQKIYQQLKIQEQMIQDEYQSFKRSRKSLINQKQKTESFMRSQIQTEAKEAPLRRQASIQQNSSCVNTQKNSQLIKKKHKLSISQQQIDQILNQPHPSKPQQFSASSCLFIPFNKLYRSPILQKAGNNYLNLNRMSKTSISVKDQKITNGIKYKYHILQTDQQSLISSTLSNKSHNHIAVVGAKDSLKKKLHMAYMAYAFSQLLSIFNSKKHNFLIFNITYQEVLSNNSQPFIIQDSIQLQTQTLKVGIMQIQRTIQQIYEVILKQKKFKKPSLQKSRFNATVNLQKTRQSISSGSTCSGQKILRCTKMTLFSGKDYLWSSTIISTNRFDAQFLKCLQVQTIVWSINPLIKNYQDVSLTLNQMKNYNEMKIKNRGK